MRFIDLHLDRKDIIVNLSPAGVGKSFALKTLVERRPDLEVIHVSGMPASVSIPAIQQWDRTTIRNNGWAADPCQTDCLGNPVLKPVKRQGGGGNCNHAELIDDLHQKTGMSGFHTWDFCKHQCEYFNSCKTSEGEGYGYFYQKKKDADKQYLRSHALSLPQDLSNKLVFIDELSKLNLYQVFNVKFDSFLNLIRGIKIAPIINLYIAILEERDANPQRQKFGFNSLDLLQLADSIFPQEEMPEWRDAIERLTRAEQEIADKQQHWIETKQKYRDLDLLIPPGYRWFFALIKELILYRNNGQPQTTFTIDSELTTITVTQINRPLANKLREVPYLIVNDATADAEDIRSFCRLLGDRFWIGLKETPPLSTKARQLSINYYQINEKKINTAHARTTTDQENIMIALGKISSAWPKRSTAIVDFKKFQDYYEDYIFLNHLGDARGSNKAENLDNLIIIGDPKESRGSLLIKYLLSYATDYSSVTELAQEAYYFKEQTKETLQEIHRLRANKRSYSDLQVLFVSRENYNWITPEIHQLRLGSTKWLSKTPQKILRRHDIESINQIIQDYTATIDAYFEVYKQQFEVIAPTDWALTAIELTEALEQLLCCVSQECQQILLESDLRLTKKSDPDFLDQRKRVRRAASEIKRLPSYRELAKTLDQFSVLIGDSQIPRMLL